VKEIGIFGSYSRKQENAESDIDFLVELDDLYNDLYHYLELKYYREELFHKKIDLVMKDSIKPIISESVFRDVKYA
jgi:uncharacterized protein